MSALAPWLGPARESLARRALLAPLLPAAWAYGAGARLHRRLYRSGMLRTRRLATHVVSVGNLSVGGNGKTPTAAWLASALQRRGRRVVLASRGYGGSAPEPVVVVSDGRRVHSRVEVAGDEALVLAARAPGVPVLVGRDRTLVGMRALSAFGAEVLVLDDGFQHHRLERTLDLVTLDGQDGFGNRRVLPRGPLREPLAALRFADAAVVVDGPLSSVDAELLERWMPGAPCVSARRRPLGLRSLDGGPLTPATALSRRAVGLLCGIARPAALRRSVEALGARVIAERHFPDHHRYTPRDVEGLVRQAPLWITTEKDASKILPAWLGPADVRALVIELAVDEPEPFLDWIESALR